MNYNNSSLSAQKIDDSLRTLILEYINAHNKGEHAKAEELLHEINTMRKLCDETK